MSSVEGLDKLSSPGVGHVTAGDHKPLIWKFIETVSRQHGPLKVGHRAKGDTHRATHSVLSGPHTDDTPASGTEWFVA